MSPPEFVVVRDRARRAGWRLEQILQERRLTWRGEDVGMATVKDDADADLVAVARDARQSVEGVLEGRLRDRERGFMEIPFVVAMETVASLVEEAASLEARRRLGGSEARGLPARIDALLSRALERLSQFQRAYDQKTPIPAPAATDLGPILARTDPGPSGEEAARKAPPLVTVPEALEDLLLRMREALGEDAGAWRIRPAAAGRPLALSLGATEGVVSPVPPPVTRAAEVLAFRHPVEVEARGRPSPEGGVRPTALRVRLGDPAGESLQAAVALAAGPSAKLSPAAERAVHALFSAPPVPEGGPPPPERLAALDRLVAALEGEVRRVLDQAFRNPQLAWIAMNLPREPVRKAPPRRALLEALEAELPGAPVERLGDLAQALARKKLSGRQCSLKDAALLLAAFGRSAKPGGVALERALALGPLADPEVMALARELLAVDQARSEIRSGPVPPELPTRLERAAIAALGRLGRIESPAA